MADPAAAGAAEPEFGPIFAGVVVFHPDPVRLRSLVATLRDQAAGVVLFLNSSLPDHLEAFFATLPNLSLIGRRENLGVGAGLNGIAGEAHARGAAGVVLFDQDSSPPPDLIDRLRSAWRALTAAARRPAVVAPLLVAERDATSKPPTYRYTRGPRQGPLRPVRFVPTSGSLIALADFERIGPFRADFFIDGIDIEWSFRASHAGYSCWVDTSCPMPHTVGAGVIGIERLGWRMPQQKPFRMYCVLRNTLYGLRLKHIPLGWKLRQLAYLPLQAGAFALHHRLRGRVVRSLALGVLDGIGGRLGPPGDLV